MATTIVVCESVGEFRDRAERWLLADEPANNLLLAIVRKLEEDPGQYGRNVRLVVVLEDGAVAGCAWRTPPFKVGLTALPLAAVPQVAADFANVYASIPGVLGPPEVAAAFARAWAEHTGAPIRPGMRHGIHRLDAVVWPPSPPPGELRTAAAGDRDLLIRWIDAFTTDVRLLMQDSAYLVDTLTAGGRLFLWDDGEPRSMVGWTGDTPHGARIGLVYTPPALRGLGYASAATAAASQRALDAGRRMCFLYTDLSNPVSNAIYARIGYRPVADSMDWEIGG